MPPMPEDVQRAELHKSPELGTPSNRVKVSYASYELSQ